MGLGFLQLAAWYRNFIFQTREKRDLVETKRRVIPSVKEKPCKLCEATFFPLRKVTHEFGKSFENGIRRWQTYVRDRTGVDA